MRVTDDGRELSPAEHEKAAESGEDSPLPAYISEPESYLGVVGVTNIDTEGERHVWFERTALRIIAEELRKAGAVPARIVPYLDADTQAWLREQGEELPTESQVLPSKKSSRKPLPPI